MDEEYWGEAVPRSGFAHDMEYIYETGLGGFCWRVPRFVQKNREKQKAQMFYLESKEKKDDKKIYIGLSCLQKKNEQDSEE